MIIENNILYNVGDKDIINGEFVIPDGVIGIGFGAFFLLHVFRENNNP